MLWFYFTGYLYLLDNLIKTLNKVWIIKKKKICHYLYLIIVIVKMIKIKNSVIDKIVVKLIYLLNVSIRVISFLNRKLNFLMKVRLRYIFERMLNIYVFSIKDYINFILLLCIDILTSNWDFKCCVQYCIPFL